MTQDEALEFWYAALHSDLGIVIETDDVTRCQQQLYQARGKSGDETLKGLSIVISPSTVNQLWIVNKEKAQEAYRAANKG